MLFADKDVSIFFSFPIINSVFKRRKQIFREKIAGKYGIMFNAYL